MMSVVAIFKLVDIHITDLDCKYMVLDMQRGRKSTGIHQTHWLVTVHKVDYKKQTQVLRQSRDVFWTFCHALR